MKDENNGIKPPINDISNQKSRREIRIKKC